MHLQAYASKLVLLQHDMKSNSHALYVLYIESSTTGSDGLQ